MNLSKAVLEGASRYKGRPVIRFNDQSYSIEWLVDETSRCAQLLVSRGVSRGDRVLLLARNQPQWLVTFFATIKIGAIVVPVNPALTANEVGYIAEHSEPALLICDADLVDTALPVADRSKIIAIGSGPTDEWGTLVRLCQPHDDYCEVDDTEPAAIFYTSGTTGRPKGVLQAHASLLATADVTAATFHLCDTDITLIPNSLSFIYPLAINALGCIRSGATVVLQERFHPELAMHAVQSERVTVLMGVPTMFTMMLNWLEGKTADCASVRVGVSAGSSLAWSVVERFSVQFAAPLFDLWGQTEGTPITSYDSGTHAQGKPDSCGKALVRCAVRVIDDWGNDLPAGEVGEVLLTGPNVMLGYFRNPEATAETLRNGWIHTGDLGKLDRDGYLCIVGRKRDMIIRGGANIYPVEIEDVIYRDVAVLECAVIGVPDDLYGENVKAIVVVKDGYDLEESAVLKLCRINLAEYKIPSIVEFVDDLPKGPTGKILKRLLR